MPLNETNKCEEKCPSSLSKDASCSRQIGMEEVFLMMEAWCELQEETVRQAETGGDNGLVWSMLCVVLYEPVNIGTLW